MAFDYEKIVADLFRKANAKGVTEAEKEALEAKAYELVEKHHVKIAKDEGVIKNGVVHYPMSFSGLHQHDQALLFNIIAKHYNVIIIDMGAKGYEISGFDSDISTVETMYSIIEPQMFASLAKAIKPPGMHGRLFNNSFLKAFIGVVKERLDAAKKATAGEVSHSTAVAIKDRAVEVRAYVNKNHPRLITKSKATYYKNEGAAQGREAGARARFSSNPEVK